MTKGRSRSRRGKSKYNKLAPLLILLLLYFAWDYFQTGPAPAPDPPRTETEVEAGQGMELHFIDVGQADCTLALCDGQSLLVDGGNREDVGLICDYLQDLGLEQLDYVVCTHAHEDHAGGLSGVLAAYPAATALVPYTEADNRWFEDFMAVAQEQGTEIIVPEPGAEYSLGQAELEILGPLLEYESVNDTSIVLRLVYGDTAFLLTGDATAQAETDLLEAGAELSADVLKVGHHGSNGSTGYRFLREVMPVYAVISCGADNSYGHPGEKTLSRLEDEEAQIYRTDLLGSIICRSDGSSVSFEPENQESLPDNQ